MSDSDSSGLSSPPSSDGEIEVPVIVPKKKAQKSKRKVDDDAELESPDASPARKKRAPSPPHEYTIADNTDIAFIVMFRARFDDAFPPTKLVQFGPQDIERGVADGPPSPQVEGLLCAILYLVLNRQKPVERGHYNRALEEAISTHKNQWPRSWGGMNPLPGTKTFTALTAIERLDLLRTLIHWSLLSSERVKNLVRDSYKQSRQDDDKNQPLSVQPWGRDGDKRRYWLIEGKDDTSFRLYRESNPALKNNTWINIAGTIDELRVQAAKLEEEGSQAARRLAGSINNSIPRFEATEEKRKRREYRMARKAQFSRPDPGFSLYEGRTRGMRMKYTFSDEEEDTSDFGSGTRSKRHSGRGTPADSSRPTVTASGRQVRSRQHGMYGESLLSGQTTADAASPATGDFVRSDGSEEPHRPTHGRSTRAAGRSKTNGHSRDRRNIDSYNSVDEMDEEDDASSSGNDWDGGDDADDEVKARDVSDDDDEMSDASDGEQPSLITVLKYGKGKTLVSKSPTSNTQQQATTTDVPPKTEATSTQHAVPIDNILNPKTPAPPAAPATRPAVPAQVQPPPTAPVPAPAPVSAPVQIQAQTPSPNRYPLTAPVNGYAPAANPPAVLPPAPFTKPAPAPHRQAALPFAAAPLPAAMAPAPVAAAAPAPSPYIPAAQSQPYIPAPQPQPQVQQQQSANGLPPIGEVFPPNVVGQNYAHAPQGYR